MNPRLLLALSLLCAACGSGSSTQDAGSPARADFAAVADLSFDRPSRCGRPGDPENSLGVGKFCTKITDCLGDGVKTNICSALGNQAMPSPQDTYFCTIYPCQTDGGAAQCGERATCTCEGANCACTPNSCLGGG